MTLGGGTLALKYFFRLGDLAYQGKVWTYRAWVNPGGPIFGSVGRNNFSQKKFSVIDGSGERLTLLPA